MKRAFADLQERQIHYRRGGEGGRTLLMLHASPGGSRQLCPLAEALAGGRRVLAPHRVRRVVLDGIGLFPPAQAGAFLEHYAPPRLPDLAGSHLPWVFQFCRDQALFFPWFAPTTENARGLGLPAAGALHDLVVDVLTCLPTYHQGYHASFRFDGPARLPLVTQRVLATCAGDDPLRAHLEQAGLLLPDAVISVAGSLRGADGMALRARAIAAFLDDGGAAL
jgi:hypothetical protein